MKIMLKPGETLEVGFADAGGDHLDGCFEIGFKARDEDGPGHIMVTSEMSDQKGRVGEIFKEEFDPDGGGWDKAEA